MSSKIFESIVAELIYVNESYHLELLKQDAGIRLFSIFTSKLFDAFPDLTSNEGKLVVVFLRKEKNILSIERQKESIKITLNAKFGCLNDTQSLFRNVSNVGHWGSGDYQVKLTNTDSFNYIIQLVKQLN